VIHSYHLVDLPAWIGARTLLRPPDRSAIDGLQHAECLALMRFGAPIVSRDPAPTFSTGAQRPPHTISTFSIWRTVREMTEMVHGRSDVPDAHVHQVAMAEQRRRDFHHESTFMRFRPLSEHGQWHGRQLLADPIREKGGRTVAAAIPR
jgi:hypothetical protein